MPVDPLSLLYPSAILPSQLYPIAVDASLTVADLRLRCPTTTSHPYHLSLSLSLSLSMSLSPYWPSAIPLPLRRYLYACLHHCRCRCRRHRLKYALLLSPYSTPLPPWYVWPSATQFSIRHLHDRLHHCRYRYAIRLILQLT